MATLRRLISLGLLILLTVSACSGAAPLAVQGQILSGESNPTQSANASSTPTGRVTSSGANLPTPTNNPAATPISSKILDHPKGCSPAPLPQSVLVSFWSDRQQENSLFPVDAATGQPLCEFEPLSVGRWFVPAFSPHGDLLAVTVSERDDGWESVLHWIDLKSWQMHATGITFPKYVISLDFSPDGQKLAISTASSPFYSYRIVIVDLPSQSVLAETTLGFLPRLLKFNADGSALVVYGSSESPHKQETSQARVMLLDAVTLEGLWETTLNGVIHGLIEVDEESIHPEGFEDWEPAVIYAPLQEKLYIVHADSDTLTSVDFHTQTTHSVEIIPATSWLERLLAMTAGVAHAKVSDGFFKTGVVSPDGSRLFVLGRTADSFQDAGGNWQFSETPLGLKVIEVATGTEIAHLDTKGTDLGLSADGQNLFITSWLEQGGTEVIDINSLEVNTRLTGSQLTPSRRLDGQPVLLSTTYHSNGQTTLAIVDAVSFEDVYEGWTTLWAGWLVER